MKAAHHWLNMALDLQSLFGLLCTAVLIGNTPPPHLGSYTRALLISKDRRHLFVTPCRSYFSLTVSSNSFNQNLTFACPGPVCSQLTSCTGSPGKGNICTNVVINNNEGGKGGVPLIPWTSDACCTWHSRCSAPWEYSPSWDLQEE